jgi:hypothetical protein
MKKCKNNSQKTHFGYIYMNQIQDCIQLVWNLNHKYIKNFIN